MAKGAHTARRRRLTGLGFRGALILVDLVLEACKCRCMIEVPHGMRIAHMTFLFCDVSEDGGIMNM